MEGFEIGEKRPIQINTFAFHNFSLILHDFALKGQSHEKVGEILVWGVSLGLN
jgi:hypothetical protein